MLITLSKQGVWRSGSALPSHGRGHWFDPSYAHMHFDVGKGSILEFLLAALFAVLTFALFIGTFFVFFGVVFGNLRDRWPSYEPAKRRKIITKFVLWGGLFVVCIFVSMIKLTPVSA